MRECAICNGAGKFATEEREDWCRHIQWWGDDYYYISPMHCHRVSEQFEFWAVCPICKTERPKIT